MTGSSTRPVSSPRHELADDEQRISVNLDIPNENAKKPTDTHEHGGPISIPFLNLSVAALSASVAAPHRVVCAGLAAPGTSRDGAEPRMGRNRGSGRNRRQYGRAVLQNLCRFLYGRPAPSLF